jgi:hypothetical protein
MPRIVFTIFVPLVCCAAICAGVLQMIELPTSGALVTPMYIAMSQLFFISILMFHMWSMLYLCKKIMASIAFAILAIATAGTADVLYAVEGLWHPFWLLLVYIAWLVVLLVFNGMWIAPNPKHESKPIKKN